MISIGRVPGNWSTSDVKRRILYAPALHFARAWHCTRKRVCLVTDKEEDISHPLPYRNITVTDSKEKDPVYPLSRPVPLLWSLFIECVLLVLSSIWRLRGVCEKDWRASRIFHAFGWHFCLYFASFHFGTEVVPTLVGSPCMLVGFPAACQKVTTSKESRGIQSWEVHRWPLAAREQKQLNMLEQARQTKIRILYWACGNSNFWKVLSLRCVVCQNWIVATATHPEGDIAQGLI